MNDDKNKWIKAEDSDVEELIEEIDNADLDDEEIDEESQVTKEDVEEALEEIDEDEQPEEDQDEQLEEILEEELEEEPVEEEPVEEDTDPFDMTPVESSNIAKIGYNPADEKLRVEFSGGGLYEYDDVPQELYDDFKEADSTGSFFYHKIRMGGFIFEQVN